jgi:putative spermidine/putrescine transport system permease protein
VTIIIAATLKGLDESLEWASLSLGASQVRTLRHVTFPLIWRGIAAGALFAFLTSFDEVIISTFIIRGAGSTLPVRIFSSLTTGLTPVVAAISTLQVVVAVAALGAMGALSHLQRKRTAGELASA